MSDEISVDKANGFIFIKSPYLVGLLDLSKSLEIIHKISKYKGLNKVMIDASNMFLCPSMLHLRSHAHELSRRSSFMKYAIVISEKTYKNILYLELAAKEHNVNMKIFNTQKDAFSWLKNGTVPKLCPIVLT